MILDRNLVLQWLNKEQDNALVERIRASLADEKTRMIANRSAKVRVSEARRLWTTRLENTTITGQTLYGIESLLKRLESPTQQQKLEQIAFTGPETSGNLFFEGAGHRFVGAVLVETPVRLLSHA